MQYLLWENSNQIEFCWRPGEFPFPMKFNNYKITFVENKEEVETLCVKMQLVM